MSMYDDKLFIPAGVKEAIELEKYKKIQDEALKEHDKLYEERQSKSWVIKPTANYVLFERYIDSPYLSSKTSNGLIMKRDLKFNKQSGVTEDMEDARWVLTGRVLDIGPDVKEIKPGMDIMFINGGQKSVPISTDDLGGEDWFIINAGNIIMYGYDSDKYLKNSINENTK